MRLEGPVMGGDPKIDFTEEEWNWGEIIPRDLIQLVGDRVAEVMWNEIIKEIRERDVRISFDDESGGGIAGDPVLVVHILDTHCIVIPLGEIRLDGEMMVVVDHEPIAVNWEKTFERLAEVRAHFERGIAGVDQLIAEAKEEQAKAQP